MNKAFEQNYFIAEKAIIINLPFPRPWHLFRLPWNSKKLLCLYVCICLYVFELFGFFVCFLFAFKQTVTILKNLRFSLTLLRLPAELV